jgi:hypothetical protein
VVCSTNCGREIILSHFVDLKTQIYPLSAPVPGTNLVAY